MVSSDGMRSRRWATATLRRHDVRSALLTGFLVPVALLGTGNAAAKTPAPAPLCSTISRTAMATLVGTGPLILEKTVGPLCEFLGARPGHYKPTFDLEIIPFNKDVWSGAQSGSIHSAIASKSHFGQVNSKLFFVSGSSTGAGMGPCTAEDKVSDELGPHCAGQPQLTKLTAIGYGKYKPTGAQLMVSTGATGQLGDVYLSHLLSLVTGILSGKIH